MSGRSAKHRPGTLGHALYLIRLRCRTKAMAKWQVDGVMEPPRQTWTEEWFDARLGVKSSWKNWEYGRADGAALNYEAEIIDILRTKHAIRAEPEFLSDIPATDAAFLARLEDIDEPPPSELSTDDLPEILPELDEALLEHVELLVPFGRSVATHRMATLTSADEDTAEAVLGAWLRRRDFKPWIEYHHVDARKCSDEADLLARIADRLGVDPSSANLIEQLEEETRARRVLLAISNIHLLRNADKDGRANYFFDDMLFMFMARCFSHAVDGTQGRVTAEVIRAEDLSRPTTKALLG